MRTARASGWVNFRVGPGTASAVIATYPDGKLLRGLGETAYGTLLLIARENGNDTDFMDIMTIYKGYSIEFVMSPNPNAASQALSDQQVQMCIDFLSNLDFVEAK